MTFLKNVIVLSLKKDMLKCFLKVYVIKKVLKKDMLKMNMLRPKSRETCDFFFGCLKELLHTSENIKLRLCHCFFFALSYFKIGIPL